MRRIAAALIIALALAGCASSGGERVQRVEVPVPVRVAPPPELLAPVPGVEGRPFVAPSDPRAVVGLTEPGRDGVVRLIEELAARLAALRAWAEAIEEPTGDDGGK